jgi:hypothetical protein
MMAAGFVSALVAALAGVTVQIPVEDPRLPEGPLWAAGSGADGTYYVEPGSYEPSDLPGLVGFTSIIVTADQAAPLHVARTWIDCKRRVYQLSSGRRYDGSGRQVAPAAWVRDRPIEPDAAMIRLADAFCPTIVDTSGLELVADYRAALEAR